jgi:capsular exopolysaccharide synthesis family protein
MSHIHRVLDKAQREGFVKRTAPVAPSERPGAVTAAPGPPQPRAVAPMPFVPEAPAPATPVVPNPFARQVRTAEPGSIHPLLVAALAPDSPVAEEYRALRTRIAQGENGRQYRALIVTSPSTGDGKTITALNLALTMAQEFHRRVLLVDADLRKGRLHHLLGLPASPGLSEVLAGEATLDQALVSLPGLHLTVLPAGGPTGLPTEMLGSAEMRRSLDLLRTQYDRIVLDTPPALALADVGVLAPMADGVLMVVRAGRTSRPDIDRALREVHTAPVLGLVLNDVEDLAPAYHDNTEAPWGAHRLRFRPRRRSA